MFRWLAGLRIILRSTIFRTRVEKELDEELRHHLEREIEEGMKAGLAPEEARYAALRAMGAIENSKEESRDARRLQWLEDFIQDCRYGIRGLRRGPVFTCVAILSLALGIGANTAIFSLMDQISFRMLPVREPERLAEIGPCCLSFPLFEELKQKLTSVDGVFARAPLGLVDITIDAQTETARVEMASGSYYSLLGVSPAIGRLFTEEMDRTPGANPVAVISYQYWERRFASHPAAIGKTFRRLDTVFTIIGVTPRDFFGTTVGQEFDITIPVTMDAQARGGESWQARPRTWWVGVIGRLKPGVRFEQAAAELYGILTRFTSAPRGRPQDTWNLRPAGRGFGNLRREVGQSLTILMGIVALVLVLACANIANLLLSRSAARQREIAVRLAIGAGRGRIVRQLITEGLLLAFAGGTVGVFLAYLFAQYLVTLISNYGPRIPLNVTPDGRVLIFAAAACIVSCILFSLAPALLATRQSFQTVLTEIRAARWRLGKGMIVLQMAISVILLIGAGLFGRTLLKLYAQNPGFDEQNIVLFSTNAQGLQYTPQRLHELQTRLVADLKALPGTESASVSAYPPVSRGSWGQGFIVEGGVLSEEQNRQASLINAVGPAFFKTLRSPLDAGREFNDRDTATSPRVAVVNEEFVRYYFPDRSPLGKWLASVNAPEQRYEIVGVVQGYKYMSLRRDITRTVYLPAAQVPARGDEANIYFIRTSADLAAVAPTVNALLKRFDTALRPVDMNSLENHVAKSVLQERMLTTLAAFFGGLALLLSAIGIYGVMAFQVARRRREIGIRMALGAGASLVVRSILGQVARLAIIGCVIGAVGGLALTRVAEEILYQVSPNDPVTFGGAITVLVLVALAAAYLPGRSAARTDPVETLKVD